MHEDFVTVVAAGRPHLTERRVRELADGRVYTAAQAMEVGLIDRVGTLRGALEAIKVRVGARHVNLVAYHRPHRHVSNYYAGPPVTGDTNIVKVELPAWLRGNTVRFMYLWVP